MEREEQNLEEARRLSREGYIVAALRMYEAASYRMQDSVELYVDWSIALMKAERIDSAITKCIKAVARDGRNVRALTQMGRLMEKIREDDGAMKCYDKAIGVNEEYAPAVNGLATIYIRRNELKKAEQMLDQLMKKGKEDIETYLVMGRLYWKQEEYMKSFEAGLEGALKWNPEKDDKKTREALNFAMRSAAKHLYGDPEYVKAMKNIENRMHIVGVESEVLKDTMWYLSDHHNLHKMKNREMDMAAQSCGRYKESKETDRELLHVGVCDFPYWEKLNEKYGKEKVNEKKRAFMKQIIAKLMSCGRDMFLEDKIYNEHKKLRGMQYAAMCEKYEEKLENVKKMMMGYNVPTTAFRAFKVMNMAMAMHLQLLYGIDLLDKYESTSEEKRMAKNIFKEYMKYREKGHEPGDEYKLTAFVAETVNMKRCLILV